MAKRIQKIPLLIVPLVIMLLLTLVQMEVFLKFIQSLLFVDDSFKYMYTYLFSTILKYVLIDFFLG